MGVRDEVFNELKKLQLQLPTCTRTIADTSLWTDFLSRLRVLVGVLQFLDDSRLMQLVRGCINIVETRFFHANLPLNDLQLEGFAEILSGMQYLLEVNSLSASEQARVVSVATRQLEALEA
jgi:hypothetical protein